MRIQNNISAMNAHRALGSNNVATSKSLEKLSSGFKINRAGDDAAGLAISEKMRAQIKGLETAQANANDGISLVQTAEGALTEVHSMLNRMTELATKSANGTIQDEVDREAIQKEVVALNEEIDRISKGTNFNGITLLDGKLSSSKTTTTEVKGTAGTIQINGGITVGKAVDGTGTKGEYTIDLKGALGQGDKIEIGYTKTDGTTGTIVAKRYGANTGAGEIAITGDTAQAQADSLKAELNSKFANEFDVSVEGTKITLKAKTEGMPADGTATSTGISAIDSVKVTDTQLTASSTVSIDTAFADGETLTIDFTKADGTAGTQITLTGKDSVVGPNQFATKAGTPAVATTKEEQAQSVANLLNQNKDFTDAFNVKVDGDRLIFESKTDKAALGAIAGTGAGKTSNTSGATDTNTAAAVAGTSMANSGLTGLVKPTSDYKVGDVLTFNFTVNGTALEARVELTADMFQAGNLNTQDGTQKIVDALNNAKFKDAAGTLTDESQFKVSDMFTVTANAKPADGTAEDGSINIGAKAGGAITFDSVTQTAIDGRTLAPATQPTYAAAATAGTSSAGAKATNYYSITEFDVNGPNFSNGDKFNLKGVLSGGSTFEVSLEAGKDFAIGADVQTTLANIKTVLDGGIYNKAGGDAVAINVKVDGKDVSSANIFGAGKEFSLFANEDIGGAAVNGNFIVSSNKSGKVYDAANTATEKAYASGGKIGVSVTPYSSASADSKLLDGTTPQAGFTSMTFEDNKVKYGSAIEIAGKTFEIVKSAADITNASNIAVVIDNIETASGDKVAQAIEDKINKDADLSKDYSAISVNGKLTVSTKAVGSAVTAPEVSLVNGTEIKTVSNKFDPATLSAGKQFTVNGQKFQLYQTGKPPVEAEAGVEYVAVDFATAKSKDVADAVATKINGDADLSKAMSATVDADGTITFASKVVEGDKFKDSTFSMDLTTTTKDGGLRLQVGDTSDDYQKVTVNVEDMSTKGLGIKEINLGTQAGAAAAMDKIKDAINTVSTNRAGLGAIQNRLEHTINNLGVATENMTAAESRIRDTDMAKEMMAFTKNNILTQAAQAMLAQANQQPQGVLQLLR